MQKLVVDTNVIVSAILSNSYPRFIVRAIFSDRTLELCVSEDIIREYQAVLSRAKFFKYPGFAINDENLLVSIEKYAKRFIPDVQLNVIGDPDDNRFLELAVTCNANFLITGNTNDFVISNYGNTKIVTPKEYWEMYR